MTAMLTPPRAVQLIVTGRDDIGSVQLRVLEVQETGSAYEVVCRDEDPIVTIAVVRVDDAS